MNGEQGGATLRREARRDSQLALGNDKLERLETRAPRPSHVRGFLASWVGASERCCHFGVPLSRCYTFGETL